MVRAEVEPTPASPTSPASSGSVERNIFSDLFEPQLPDASATSTVMTEIGLMQSISHEIKLFVSKFPELDEIKSTNSFWKKNREDLKHLYKLSEIIFNISSTSAQLERFFSISGLVCDKRRMRMTNELVIKRAMLKANLSLLSEINQM